MVERITKAFRTWPAEPRVHRWTKQEYYRAGEAGVFKDRRVELMGGEIVDMSPIGPLNAALIAHVHRVLEQRLPGHHIRNQLPIDAAEDSEPEPDLAVVEGEPLDYADAHPKRVGLIVEVADWSLTYDRGPKASRYAASGVPDYWVMNLPARQVEVFRDPKPDSAQVFGAGYASHTIATIDDVLTPLKMPNVTIPVRDLFPATQSKSG